MYVLDTLSIPSTQASMLKASAAPSLPCRDGIALPWLDACRLAVSCILRMSEAVGWPCGLCSCSSKGAGTRMHVTATSDLVKIDLFSPDSVSCYVIMVGWTQHCGYWIGAAGLRFVQLPADCLRTASRGIAGARRLLARRFRN
jgi:hypothetical protein